MKKFLIRLIVFSIPVLILMTSMEIYMRNLKSSYTLKIEALERNKDKVELLILGNSHAFSGVDPNELHLFTINLANANQSIYFDKRIVLKHLYKLTNLKFVLISVDFHSLNFSDQGIRNLWSYYGNGVRYESENYFRQDFSAFATGYGPNFSFGILLKQLKNKSKSRGEFYFDVEPHHHAPFDLEKGYTPYKGQNEEEWTDEYIKKRADHFLEPADSMEKLKVTLDLKDFVEQLKSKGIQPIFFSCPTFKDYNSLFPLDKIEVYKKEIQELADELNVPFWNYAFDNDFKKEEFFNADHLNQKGAARFGKILNKRLQE